MPGQTLGFARLLSELSCQNPRYACAQHLFRARVSSSESVASGQPLIRRRRPCLRVSMRFVPVLSGSLLAATSFAAKLCSSVLVARLPACVTYLKDHCMRVCTVRASARDAK